LATTYKRGTKVVVWGGPRRKDGEEWGVAKTTHRKQQSNGERKKR